MNFNNPKKSRSAPVSKHQVVVITGAGAGIGRATVREFARAGARIGLIERDPARLEQAADEVRRLGGEALICKADVADAEQVEAATANVAAEFWRIDIYPLIAAPSSRSGALPMLSAASCCTTAARSGSR